MNNVDRSTSHWVPIKIS